MPIADLVFTLIKIAAITVFCLSIGGALTWNDRRMSSMIQDRIGPNRARFLLPQRLAQGLFAAPALLAALGLAAWTGLTKLPDDALGHHFATERIIMTSHLAVLVTWVGLAVFLGVIMRTAVQGPLEKSLVENLRSPRLIVYGGLATHVALVALRFGLRGTELASTIKPALTLATPLVLAFVIAVSGLVAAARVPAEGFKLRLIGLLHTMADGIKMIWKEDFIPKDGDRLLHSLAPMIALFPPLVVFAVIPFGDVACFASNPDGTMLLQHGFLPMIEQVVPRDGVCSAASVPMQIAQLDVGLLFIFAIAGTGVLGAAVGGWASNNKYSLMGGLRAAGQMVSYEVTLGLTLIGLIMIYSTVRLDDMVRWQGENAWGIFVQPFAFFLFFIAAVAETKRIPFDLPEGESEIVGYFTEYSGMKFGMFFFAEYIEVVTSSALMVTLFLGGWQLPFLHRDGLTIAIGDALMFKYAMTHGSVVIIQVLAFFLKVLAVCWVQVVIRWTLPRFRYDQLMKLCWRILLPLSVGNVIVTGAVMLGVQGLGEAMQSALKVSADMTQAVLALALVVGVVAAARWLLQPSTKQKNLLSSSAQMADAQGGTITEPQQA